ncbi:hypothetical protein F4804DRAFT_159781 [Jackrogersella minutella]|nr:hypothetical protein F4804DRAFT_159781 [Jackrogersella minutella]
MGNCMSTLGGQRKQRVASPSQQEAISLAIKASMNKEKAPAPTKPYPNESYGPAFPNGDILLTTADDLTRETSVPSTFVDSPGPQKNEAPANDDALAIAPVPNDHASAYCAHGATSGHKNAPTGDGGIKLDNDDFLEDAEIGIAKAVSITHMGKARIVETKSAANLHSARSASGPANLFRPSATMVDMNKARQMYPGNDPVAAYVERDNLRVKNASEKWEPRARELQANHRRRVAADSARRQMELAEATKSEIQEIAQSSGSAPRMYGPPVVGRGDVNTGFVGERGPMVPMRPAQPSPVYLQQGRSFSQPKVSRSPLLYYHTFYFTFFAYPNLDTIK